jgi:sugar phosphate isomerase/epimerase
MMKYPVGLSRNLSNNAEEILSGFPKAGITHLELSPLDYTEEYALDFKKIEALAKANGVKIWSCHLPFWPFDILELSKKELKENTIAYMKKIIDRASEIGVDKFVVHASGEPIEDCEREERMKTAQDSLFQLAQYAKQKGGVIAVEDLPRSCLGKNSEEILKLISVHEDLRVCFDTNHLFNEDLAEFVKKVGNKLITLHVSDYDFVNERHWLPGEGKIDWQAVLKALDEVGYNGVWLYEIGAKCPNSILRDRDLTDEDFVRNANELFDKKTPTVFSKPKPNLGFWE